MLVAAGSCLAVAECPISQQQHYRTRLRISCEECIVHEAKRDQFKAGACYEINAITKLLDKLNCWKSRGDVFLCSMFGNCLHLIKYYMYRLCTVLGNGSFQQKYSLMVFARVQ